MQTAAVDDAVLAEIVRRLVEAVDPDRIVLFDSRARGESKPGSDVDILLIKDSNQPKHHRAVLAYKALTGIDISIDVLWRTPAEVAEWAEVPSHVIGRALREGRVLHEKRS